MSDHKKYNCPMCGVGKLDVETFDPNATTRLLVIALILCVLFLGSGFLYWMTLPPSPREPSVMEQCSTACGPGRFKSWTEAQPRRESADGKYYLPSEPAKCECVVPP